MHASESLHYPPKFLPNTQEQPFNKFTEEGARWKTFNRIFPFHGISIKGGNSTDIIREREVEYQIKEYTRRELTYDYDILNAISWVLQCYENGAFKLEYYWGMPIISGTSTKTRKSADLFAETLD